MRTILAGAALAAASIALAACGDSGVSSAKADTTAQADATVTAIGCPKTPKPDCVTVTADGKTWDVTGAGVDLKKGVAVSVTGVPAGAGACGTKLTGASVDYTGLRCAAPAS
jgi:hypothetical protein